MSRSGAYSLGIWLQGARERPDLQASASAAVPPENSTLGYPSYDGIRRSVVVVFCLFYLFLCACLFIGIVSFNSLFDCFFYFVVSRTRGFNPIDILFN